MPLTDEQLYSDLIDEQVTLMPSTNMIKHTLILKMTTALIVQTSVTVNNSISQDYTHLDSQISPT